MERLRRAWAQAKREADLREEEKGGKEESDGVVCDSEYVSVYEMRKEFDGRSQSTSSEDGANHIWEDTTW